MGNVVGLPLRGMAGDLDMKMEIAALMVGVHTLIGIAGTLAPDATAEITLNSERRRITRTEAMDLAQDMLRQREECLAVIGGRAARQLLAEVERAFGRAYQGEGLLREVARRTESATRKRRRAP